MHSNCYEVLNSPVYPSQWFVCIPSCQRFTRCVSQDITSLIFLNLKSHFKWKWKCELDLNLWTLIFCLRFIYINMNVTYSKSALILICLSYRKTHYVNMYRYTKIVQNMTTSKLMNAFKIGAGVLSKDTRLLPCVWNDNWSIDHSMFCVFSPSSLSHPLPSSKQERFQQNCQFSARRINDPQKHRKDARNEKDEGGKEYLRHFCSILRTLLGPLYKRSIIYF